MIGDLIGAIPSYIQYFVLIGILILIVVIPIKIVWESTRGSRETGKKNRAVADRLREKFGEVSFQSGVFCCDRIHFKHDRRKLVLYLLSPTKAILKIDAAVSPKFHVAIRTRNWWPFSFRFSWESMRLLWRFKLADALLDEKVQIFSSNAFGHYLTELALDGIPLEGKPAGIAESLVILSNLDGVRKFRLTMSPAAGLRLHLKLHTEDILIRPDEMESAVHHMLRLYDAFVNY